MTDEWNPIEVEQHVLRLRSHIQREDIYKLATGKVPAGDEYLVFVEG